MKKKGLIEPKKIFEAVNATKHIFSVAEYTDDYGRQQLYISGWVTWVFGTAALALIAWATAEWFSYGLVTTLVNVIFIPFFL